MIPYRTLGRTGERVSAIGLGGYHLGKPYLQESESIRIIRTAIDRGATFLDNSWDYYDGQSELRMGKALGVCLTVIGLFRVVSHLKNINSVADNLMAVDALVFLGSCFLSYLALRSLKAERSLALERAADVVFLLGLGTMVALCALVAWELI
jgi:hypothetical protein